MMSPRFVDKEEKKRDILMAAMRVFAQGGVVKTKMADIAAAAGIGKGTIYEYFRSKEDIFAAAYHQMFEGVEEKIEAVMADDIEPEEKLRQLMVVTVEGVLGDGGEFAGIMMAFWSEGIRNRNDRILDVIDLKQLYAEFRGIISSILTEGIQQGRFRKVDISLTASVLIGAMDGILLQLIMEPKIFTPDQVVSVLMDTFLNGLKI
jgi:TetR/AcrR family fatty acid metabolism transcriptional regulator